MDLSALAAQVLLPQTYAAPNEVYSLLKRIRNEEPVIWVEPEGIRPLWLVTRAEDLKFVETNSDIFVAGKRSALQPAAQEAKNLELFGRPQGPMSTLIDMDGEHHRSRRLITQTWFGANRIKSQLDKVEQIAKTFIERMATLQPECDFATDVAFRYPMRVINAIMGLPEELDEPFLQLTQQTFGTADADFTDLDNELIMEQLGKVHMKFQAMFEPIIADRRENPRDDLATVLANAEIDGERLPDPEILGYFLIVATAGHDTTSATTAGALEVLAQHPEQLKALKDNPDLMPGAVEEFFRWIAPVKNFIRTATKDVELGGKTIKEGEDVAVMFASTCRDEAVFDDPDTFRIDRKPNNHMAFGTGPHLCLGMHLARMEVSAFYRELIPRLESVELTGDPSYMQSAFVTGLKSLPIRFKMN